MDTVTQKLGQTLKNGQFWVFLPILGVFDHFFFHGEKSTYGAHFSVIYIRVETIFYNLCGRHCDRKLQTWSNGWFKIFGFFDVLPFIWNSGKRVDFGGLKAPGIDFLGHFRSIQVILAISSTI